MCVLGVPVISSCPFCKYVFVPVVIVVFCVCPFLSFVAGQCLQSSFCKKYFFWGIMLIARKDVPSGIIIVLFDSYDGCMIENFADNNDACTLATEPLDSIPHLHLLWHMEGRDVHVWCDVGFLVSLKLSNCNKVLHPFSYL